MKTFQELSEKTLTVSQRRKKGIKMKALARSSAFQAKKKRSLMRIRDISKLQVIARKKVIQGIRDKFYQDYYIFLFVFPLRSYLSLYISKSEFLL